MWMRLRTSSEATAIKDAEKAKTFGFDQIQDKGTRDIEESYEDERTEWKLKAKMPELESKDGPPSLDEDKEFLSLTDDLAGEAPCCTTSMEKARHCQAW
jgi:hypothetical protein